MSFVPSCEAILWLRPEAALGPRCSLWLVRRWFLVARRSNGVRAGAVKPEDRRPRTEDGGACGKPAERRCSECYFACRTGRQYHCLRSAPAVDPATGAGRWPLVKATGICGEFRHAGDCPLVADRRPRRGVPVYADELGPYCRIPLGHGRFAKVDPEDYGWLAQFRWHIVKSSRTCYAVRSEWSRGTANTIWMHREVMETPEGLVVDHIRHDGLDNRKAGLRNCTTAENNLNRRHYEGGASRYKGVFRCEQMGKWGAGIQAFGRQKFLGYYEREIDAARAYDAAALKLHGRFASVNFPARQPPADVRSEPACAEAPARPGRAKRNSAQRERKRSDKT